MGIRSSSPPPHYPYQRHLLPSLNQKYINKIRTLWDNKCWTCPMPSCRILDKMWGKVWPLTTQIVLACLFLFARIHAFFCIIIFSSFFIGFDYYICQRIKKHKLVLQQVQKKFTIFSIYSRPFHSKPRIYRSRT